ncbi:hypothetical protein PR048_001755 [Dryococelus australis]|uniref:DUF4371 domain-containing protein n=1 Tax=Dryococelus australis TaxID=614101 RepID=A0ABQ9IIE7_9NEOP|nr:hypothetical protein PR048_001755 [Dryococelus australis]
MSPSVCHSNSPNTMTPALLTSALNSATFHNHMPRQPGFILCTEATNTYLNTKIESKGPHTKPTLVPFLVGVTLPYFSLWEMGRKISTGQRVSCDSGRGGWAVRLLASQQDEQGSIPGQVTPRFSQMGIVPDDATGQRVFSKISRFPRPSTPTLLHSQLTSPSSTLKTSLLRATQISQLSCDLVLEVLNAFMSGEHDVIVEVFVKHPSLVSVNRDAGVGGAAGMLALITICAAGRIVVVECEARERDGGCYGAENAENFFGTPTPKRSRLETHESDDPDSDLLTEKEAMCQDHFQFVVLRVRSQLTIKQSALNKNNLMKELSNPINSKATSQTAKNSLFAAIVMKNQPSKTFSFPVTAGRKSKMDSRCKILASAIQDALRRLNLSLDNLRRHCFDGAANMPGCEKGVQKILIDEQPKSLYVHCANHAADLALQEVSRKMSGMCDILCLVKDFSNVILDSSKRRHIYADIVLQPCNDNEE